MADSGHYLKRNLTPRLAGVLGLGVILFWTYWPSLRDLPALWSENPLYSHGYIIPILALVLLYHRRRPIPDPTRAEAVLGLGILLVASLARLGSAYIGISSLDPLSLLPCLAGIACLAGGKAALRWALPAIGLLVFLFPLPYQVEVNLSQPLQQMATEGSGAVLRGMRLPASTEGNILVLEGVRLGIVEACSGLGMLFAMLGLTGTVAFVRHRPWLDRWVVLLSAIPLAVGANILRITATALFFRSVEDEASRRVFHDVAGWVVLLIAFAVVGIELLLCEVYRRTRRTVRVSEPVVLPSTVRAERISIPALQGGPPAMLPRETPRMTTVPPGRSSDGAHVPRTPLPPAPASTLTVTAPASPPRGYALPPALAQPVTVLNLVQALRRRWILGVSLGLVLAVITAITSWRMLPPAKYSAFTARALVRVNAYPPKVVADSGRDDFQVYRSTVIALIKSRFVLDDVLRDPTMLNVPMLTMQENKVEFLKSELQVDTTVGAEILRISLSGEDPEDLMKIVNTVTKTAITNIRGKELMDKEKRLKDLENIQNKYEEALSSERERLSKLGKGIGTQESPAVALIQVMMTKTRLDSLIAERETARRELRNTEIQLDLKKNGKTAATPDPVPPKPSTAPGSATPPFEEDAIRSDAEEMAALTAVAGLREDMRQLVDRATSLAAAERIIKERRLPEQIMAHEMRITKYRQRKLDSTAKPIVPSPDIPPAELAATIPQLEARLAFHTENVKRLTNDIEKESAANDNMRSSIHEIEEIKDRIKAREDVNKTVKQLMEVMRVEMLAADRMTLVEEAEKPTHREERRHKFAALAGMAMFAFALFGVAFLDFRTRRIHRMEEVAQGLEIPVVGTLPRGVTFAANGSLPWYELPNDGIDTTRALFSQTTAGMSSRVLVVTSALGGEGVTTTAVQIAASLARAGRRTLLIDANLRKPAAHLAFGLENEAGLSEVLRGEVAAAVVIQPAPLDRLWVLSAGKGDLRAVQGLSRDVAFSLLEQLRRDYEWIVCDATPVVPAADSLPLTQRADMVVVSVLAGESSTPAVFSGWQRLTVLGAKVVGAVVHGATDDTSTNYSYAFHQRVG